MTAAFHVFRLYVCLSMNIPIVYRFMDQMVHQVYYKESTRCKKARKMQEVFLFNLIITVKDAKSKI